MSLYQSSRMFRVTVIFSIVCFTTFLALIVYGIAVIRPDRIAEKRDVAAAQAALEARLHAEDMKRDAEHAELIRRIKATKTQQDRNVKEIRRLKARLGE